MRKTELSESSARGPRPRPNETYMKKPESTATPTIARGKYANLLKQGTNVVVLDPALMPFFQTRPR